MSKLDNLSTAAKTIVLGSWFGWALDGYDLVLMLFVISSVSQLFFPTGDQRLAILATFATYAATLVVRPLGGAIFGAFGDRVGRKRAMIITIVGFSSATFATGMLPTWQAIGIISPLLLVALRIFQGLFAGGEWGSGAVISMESVPKHSRGFVSGFLQSGFPFGFLIASLAYWAVSTIFPGGAFLEVGWRVMFFTGIVPSLLALILRLKMNESEIWNEKLRAQELEKAPLRKIVSGSNRKPLFLTLAITTGLMYSYYASIGFMPTLLSQYIRLTETQTASVMAAGTFSSMVGYIFCGWLSQRIGRIRAIGIFASATTILAIPLLLGLFHAQGLFERGLYSSILIMVATSGFGPIPAFLSERFSTAIRNTAAGFAFNGGLIIGAWAPLIAVSQSVSSGFQPIFFAANLMIGSILVLAGLRINPETRNADLRKTEAS
ncbi:MAG TPA: MFS transporter [Candidatus Nitrosotalea sp.]|nr:MFS transporter [Candidatus Nitrosotalea sp.]